jgi:hypothetical protein
MVARRQLRCVEVFLWPILTQWSGKLCIHALLRRVSLILPIVHVNEVIDVCCMCHIFACLSSVGIVNMCDTFACLGYSRLFVLKVCRLQVGFHSMFMGSILAHSSTCALPSSGLLICVGDFNSLSLVSLCAAFERAFDVSKFGVGVVTSVC